MHEANERSLFRYMDEEHYGFKLNHELSKLIYKAIKTNKIDDVNEAIEKIITIEESYKYPEAYYMKKDELGRLITIATLPPIDKIKKFSKEYIKEPKEIEKLLKQHIDEEILEDLRVRLKNENKNFKKFVRQIHEINNEAMSLNPSNETIDINFVNKCRSIFTTKDSSDAKIVYGKYTKKFLFYIYWEEESEVAEVDKPYWVMDLLKPSNGTRFTLKEDLIEEDTDDKRKKRTKGNDHTIKDKIKKLFSIDIDELKRTQDNQDIDNQYETLCDIIESVTLNPETIKNNVIKDKEKDPYVSKNSHYIFKIFNGYNDLNNSKNNIVPLDLFDYEYSFIPFNNSDNLKYKIIMAELIFELKRHLKLKCPDVILNYDRAIYESHKWYGNLQSEIECEYYKHWNTDLEPV